MKRVGLILSIVAFAATAVMCWHFRSTISNVNDPLTDESQSVAVNPPPTVSEATTYATDPLNADGFVDYYAVLNQRMSKGVTVGTNAAVLFFKAGVGGDITLERRQKYCQLLGIDASELTGPGFQKLAIPDAKARKQINDVTTKPWLAEKYPRIREWLEVNEASLELIIEGTQRPHCFIPLIPGDDDASLMHAPLEFHQNAREVARCLIARSMLRIGDGQTKQAERDILTCHRLGRMLGESPFFIAGLLSTGFDAAAWQAEAALLQRAKLSASDASAFQRELRQLKPLPAMIDKLDFGERLSLLDTVMKKESGSDFELPFILASVSENAKTETQVRLIKVYDESLCRCNERIDQFVTAGRIANFPERRDAIAVLTNRLREMARLLGGPQNAISQVLANSREQTPTELGRQIGDAYFTFLFPSVDDAINAEMLARMRNDLMQVGFSLAAFREERTEYPQSLDALVPGYLSEIPLDRFNGKSLHYNKKDDGYLLYSVGVNGIDDAAHASDSDSLVDDVVLKIRGRRSSASLE